MECSENNQINGFQVIDEPEIKNTDHKYIHSVQSANVLFKFFDKIDYLKDTIKYRAMIPRYYEEVIDYMELKNIGSISFPMCCFCDISLSKLLPHMNFYGGYGIGLNKQWGIEKGIQPIQYINTNSELIKSYKEIFTQSLKNNEEDRQAFKKYSDYLLTNMLFMKPLEGKMFRDGQYQQRNFHDEREWRYIPNINNCDTELPLIIPSQYNNPGARTMYSNGIIECDNLWLKFKYSNIKYLIVKNHSERRELIEFIKSQNTEMESEKLVLNSKILVFNELKEDL